MTRRQFESSGDLAAQIPEAVVAVDLDDHLSSDERGSVSDPQRFECLSALKSAVWLHVSNALYFSCVSQPFQNVYHARALLMVSSFLFGQDLHAPRHECLQDLSSLALQLIAKRQVNFNQEIDSLGSNGVNLTFEHQRPEHRQLAEVGGRLEEGHGTARSKRRRVFLLVGCLSS